MVWDTTGAGPNLTFSGNETHAPPNGTFLWPIPPDAGRSLQPDIIACSVITFLIATAFVVLRFYTRGRVNNVLGASDWCILPALLCAAGVTASSLEQVAHGAGKHVWDIDPFAVPSFERAAWYGMLFYNLSLTLSRISILLLYKRIFTYSWIKRAIQIVLILVSAIGIWFIVSVCTACMPLEAFWDWSLFFKGPVYCQPANLWWANAGLHISSDLVVMALPMPVLSSLNLPRRQKYAIVGVFALGFFVCIISIVRLMALINITQYPSWDGFYSSANMIYWTTVEVNAAIACACIMTLKPLIQRVFPRLLSPSKGIREPTLQWITPVNNDSIHETSHRNSTPAPINPLTRRMSNTSPHIQHHCCSCSCADSNTPINSNSNSGNTLPNLYSEHSPTYRQHNHPDHDTIEKSHYYHSFTTMKPSRPDITGNTLSVIPASTTPVPTEYDLDHDLDLEAQRTCSLTSTAGCTNTTMNPNDNPNNNNNNHNHDHNIGAHSTTTSNSSTGGSGGAGDEADERPLRAPPRAHLRLDIRVARAAARDSWSRSPGGSSSPGSGLGSAVGPGPGPGPGPGGSGLSVPGTGLSAPGSGRRRSVGWGTTASSGGGGEMREVGT